MAILIVVHLTQKSHKRKNRNNKGNKRKQKYPNQTKPNQKRQRHRRRETPLLCGALGSANDARVDLGGEAQRADGLLEVDWLRGHVDKHQRLAVATQRVLQQVGELGVAVGDVLLLVGQRVDHVRQAAQALVDGLCFLKAVARRARSGEPLGPSQVNQVQDTLAPLFSDGVVPNELQDEDAE